MAYFHHPNLAYLFLDPRLPSDPREVLNRLRGSSVGQRIYLLFLFGTEGTHRDNVRDMIVQNYGFVHISMNRMFEIVRDNPRNLSHGYYWTCRALGVPIPPRIASNMALGTMMRSPIKNFIIDDVPPEIHFYNELISTVGTYTVIPLVIHLHAPIELCLRRSLDENLDKRFGIPWDILRDGILYHKDKLVALMPIFRDHNILVEFNCYGNKEDILTSVKMLMEETFSQGHYPGAAEWTKQMAP